MAEHTPGRIITFYSFKGGTGRSMALANIATTIAQRSGGNRVVAVDWDLEAPGLHRYFRPYVRVSGPEEKDKEIDKLPGLIELLTVARGRAADLSGKLSREELGSAVFADLRIEDYLVATDLPQLTLLKAGRFDASYSSRINTFDWEGIFATQPEFFGAFADFLAARFTHVLIDSRTGYTDISGICTSLMPDTLVAVFTPNRQSLQGALDVVERAVKYRAGSDDLRPLRTFPLASRVELSELRLNEAWRFGNGFEDIQGFQPQFERLFVRVYGLERCDLTTYFDEAQVPYVPYYAFGERVAVRSEESATVRLGKVYSRFTDLLSSSAAPWECAPSGTNSPNSSGADAIAAVPWDNQWFEDQKTRALPGISGLAGFMEVRFSLSRVKTSSSRKQLLEAARSSDMSLPGGLLQDRDGNPVPTNEGIESELKGSRAYSYWSLRENGDFFILRSLPEDEGLLWHLSPSTRITQIAGTMLFCKRLYDRLGVTPRAEVRVSILHEGLTGRPLSAVNPATTPYEGAVSTATGTRYEGEFVIGRIEGELVQIVRAVAAPLFETFNFQSFDDSVYESVVGSYLSQLSGKTN